MDEERVTTFSLFAHMMRRKARRRRRGPPQPPIFDESRSHGHHSSPPEVHILWRRPRARRSNPSNRASRVHIAVSSVVRPAFSHRNSLHLRQTSDVGRSASARRAASNREAETFIRSLSSWQPLVATPCSSSRRRRRRNGPTRKPSRSRRPEMVSRRRITQPSRESSSRPRSTPPLHVAIVALGILFPIPVV